MMLLLTGGTRSLAIEAGGRLRCVVRVLYRSITVLSPARGRRTVFRWFRRGHQMVRRQTALRLGDAGVLRARIHW